MTSSKSDEKGLFGQYKDIGRNVFTELKNSELRRHVRRDVQGLYDFYVDEDTRARIDRTRRIPAAPFSLLVVSRRLQ